ncbi:ATP-binding protein [Streptomyces sp. NPDC017936]|uniref:ATP-binding protein n=1 Tax=Streptomyces sp. NPDC017936 TaxID=3365016 RepID=UPI003796FD5A
MSVCFEVYPPQAGADISEPDARRVGMARRLVAARLRYCGLETLVDDATLIVSELVTSALQHGHGAQVTFTMAVRDGFLHLAVHDETPGRPVVRYADDDAEQGRGLFLVDCLAAAHSRRALREGGGMTHPQTPAHAALPRTRENTVRTEPPLIPFVVQPEGEEAAPANLILTSLGPDRYRLRYADEDPRDRDLRGVLWARCSFGEVDDLGMSAGKPQWRMMHPLRQRGTMQALRCQVCTDPARTPLGYVFLAGPNAMDLEQPVILTNQPPVCSRHARPAADLCPHLTRDPMVFLAQSAPLYGVTGFGYGYGDQGVQVVARPDGPIPYGHPLLPTVLASQLVRRLSSFRTVALDELLWELERAAWTPVRRPGCPPRPGPPDRHNPRRGDDCPTRVPLTTRSPPHAGPLHHNTDRPPRAPPDAWPGPSLSPARVLAAGGPAAPPAPRTRTRTRTRTIRQPLPGRRPIRTEPS